VKRISRVSLHWFNQSLLWRGDDDVFFVLGDVIDFCVCILVSLHSTMFVMKIVT